MSTGARQRIGVKSLRDPGKVQVDLGESLVPAKPKVSTNFVKFSFSEGRGLKKGIKKGPFSSTVQLILFEFCSTGQLYKNDHCFADAVAQRQER